MDEQALFRAHVATARADVEAALEASRAAGRAFDGVVFHAGTDHLFHDDDQHVPFRPVFHFARFAPQPGPHHLLVVEPGKTPRLVRVVPRDFWYEPPATIDHPFMDVLDVEDVGSADEAQKAVGARSTFAYVGNDASVAAALGIAETAVQPDELMHALDWRRGFKTDYEVACVRRAAERSAPGFAAVRAGFEAGASERELHAAYLAATEMLENDCPYGTIIGYDTHAAVLHYQSKVIAKPAPGRVLLIDAGAVFQGYASDVTRTWMRPGGHAAFGELIDGIDALELELLERCTPGQSYIELHRAAHRRVAELLGGIGVLKVSADEALEKKLTLPFFPHGLGHHLGLQVHDVGGRQAGPDGSIHEPPPDFPSLRTTRPVEAGHVLTIEPGLYFIPMLLEPVRNGDDSGAVDWALVDELTPYGGIRIEDDVHVTADGPVNLTRSLIPGHR